MVNQFLIVQGGTVILSIPLSQATDYGSGVSYWCGPQLEAGDPAPESLSSLDKISMPGTPSVNGCSPLEIVLKAWLEVFGDWINELQFAATGVYKSKFELLQAWSAKIGGG